LDSSVEPLMLGKIIVEGFGLINIDFKPCLHQILTSMIGPKNVWRLTKHEVVIQINPNKPIVRLYHNVNGGYACYILWHIVWKSDYIPLKDYPKFIGGNHILQTKIVNMRQS
jgi:hypothetical protein